MTSTLAFLGVAILFVMVWVAISQLRRQQQNEAWKQFAGEIGAEFVEGGFFRSSKVQAHVSKWTATLETYSVSSGDSSETYARMKSPIQEKDGFWFTIFRTGLVAKLDKAIGVRDLEIGDPDFDQAFTIRSNNGSKVRSLF